MILQSLRELALREGLVDNPTLESKPVRWVIEVRPDGRFRRVYDTNMPQTIPEGSKKKPKDEARLMVIPRRCIRSSGIRANFLVDNAKYVLGLDPDDDIPSAKNRPHAEAFLHLLDDASASVPSPELGAVRRFLSTDGEKTTCAQELMKQGGFASNDLFTFEIEGELLHEDEGLRTYLTQNQSEPESEQQKLRQCLVCGEHRLLTPLHNQIQIRGASTSGVPLVSFNTGAFEKYGWSGNENAPVCTECMTAYVESLRRLTRPRYDNPRTGKRVEALSSVLTGDTTASYWAAEDVPLIAGLAMLRDDPKIVKDLLKTPRTGVERLVDDPARFFCLILTGMQGRAAVRRVHTGTVGEVAANLQRYFTAIHVDRFDATAPLPQYRLMQSMVLKGELDRLPAELGTELWLAALFATPLSRRFLATVVGRNQAEQKVPPERAALLQLYFALRNRIRLRDSQTPQDLSPLQEAAPDLQEKAEPMSLDLNYDNKAYLLGRLLAVLESMQTAAQSQGLNRTLVDRFFGAAATRPGTVFPQLLELAIHHKNKASKVSPRKVAALDKMLGAILDGIPAQEGFGRSLDLEGQGRFALGYYQQRQQMIRDAMEAKARREQAKAAGSDTQDSMEEEDPMSTDTGELA